VNRLSNTHLHLSKEKGIRLYPSRSVVRVFGVAPYNLRVIMPLGWERINVKRSTPNKNIVFIKPRPGPDESTAKDFLERIAAQCLPIMNKHHLAVVSLEEYEPNLEFWGM